MINFFSFSSKEALCVASRQGQAGPWYSCRRKNIPELLGCLACLYSQVGEPSSLQAACLSVCLIHGSCSPVWLLSPCVSLIITTPSRESLPVLSTRGEQSWKTAKALHNILVLRLKEIILCYGNSLSDPVSRL